MKTESTKLPMQTILPSGAHLGDQGPPRWAPEGRIPLGGRYRQVSLYYLENIMKRSWHGKVSALVTPYDGNQPMPTGPSQEAGDA